MTSRTKRLTGRVFLILATGAMLLTVCCKKNNPGSDTGKPDNQDNPGNPETPTPSGPYCIATIPEVVLFNAGGGLIGYTLKTNIGEFTVVSGDESWCTARVDNTEDENISILNISTTEYDIRDENGVYVYDPPRTTTISITGGEVFDRTFIVAQNTNVNISTPLLPNEGFGPVLRLSADGETAEVLVNTNCYRWTPSTEANWLTVSRKDLTTLLITSTPRTDSSPRKAAVTLTDDADSYNNRHTIIVADKDAVLTGTDYDYGEGSEWD